VSEAQNMAAKLHPNLRCEYFAQIAVGTKLNIAAGPRTGEAGWKAAITTGSNSATVTPPRRQKDFPLSPVSTRLSPYMLLTQDVLRSLVGRNHRSPHAVLGLRPLAEGSGLMGRAFLPAGLGLLGVWTRWPPGCNTGRKG
jgi:hypothetical protein